MKRLNKDVFYYWGPGPGDKKRLWHDCKKYKGDQARRVELEPGELSEGYTLYVCPWCGFDYILDDSLELQRAKPEPESTNNQ